MEMNIQFVNGPTDMIKSQTMFQIGLKHGLGLNPLQIFHFTVAQSCYYRFPEGLPV